MKLFWKSNAQNSKRDQSLTRAVARLRNGITVQLLRRKEIFVELLNTERLKRPNGLETSAYSYQSIVRGGGFSGYGYGESDNRELAVAKSISEAFERVVFKNCRGLKEGSWNSNGWASHTSLDRAKKAALLEAVERDGVLKHWLEKSPFLEIDPETYPAWLSDIQKKIEHTDFVKIRILEVMGAYVGTALVLLQKENGRGVLAHHAGTNLQDCVRHALSECARIAHLVDLRAIDPKEVALKFENGSCSPEDHAQLFAYGKPFPGWMFGSQTEWEAMRRRFLEKEKNLEVLQKKIHFTVATESPFFVVRCHSKKLQDLFVGSTESAIRNHQVNWKRLEIEPNSIGKINLEPHPVA